MKTAMQSLVLGAPKYQYVKKINNYFFKNMCKGRQRLVSILDHFKGKDYLYMVDSSKPIVAYILVTSYRLLLCISKFACLDMGMTWVVSYSMYRTSAAKHHHTSVTTDSNINMDSNQCLGVILKHVICHTAGVAGYEGACQAIS